jgi:hypothetical protein
MTWTSQVEGNAYILVNSEDRDGDSVSVAYFHATTYKAGLFGSFISFRSNLFIENVNTYNNTFLVNGTTITIPIGSYSITTFMTALKLALDTALGPLVFTVTNVSTMGGNNFRIRIQCTGPFSVDFASRAFEHLSGIDNSAASMDVTYAYTNLAYTDYFDVTFGNSGFIKAESDMNSFGSGQCIFRVPFNQFTMEVDKDYIIDQSSKKRYEFHESTLIIQLFDMFGRNLSCSGSWYLQGIFQR